MTLRAVACFAALITTVLPAYADNAAAPTWKHDNAFCGALASVVSTGDPGSYAVGLFTGAGTTIDAHVTLVGKTDAYDAYVTAAPLTGAPGDLQSEGVVAKLPPDAHIGWYYVDSYAVDGGATITCPSYIFVVDDRTVNVPENARTIDVRHLQALPPLKCGHVYTPAEMGRGLEAQVSSGYGDHSLVVVARSSIDSNGYSMREEIVQSSGVAGFDSYMLGAMHTHQFKPAQFLCTPVVGTVEVELKYGP